MKKGKTKPIPFDGTIDELKEVNSKFKERLEKEIKGMAKLMGVSEEAVEIYIKENYQNKNVNLDKILTGIQEIEKRIQDEKI